MCELTPPGKGEIPCTRPKSTTAENVLTKAVKGWTVTDASGRGVVAAIQYSETPEKPEGEDSRAINLALTAVQCLDLADALTRAARNLLRSRSPGPPLR